MAKGFNPATQLAMSVAASAGKLFRLSVGEIANELMRRRTSRSPVCLWNLYRNERASHPA